MLQRIVLYSEVVISFARYSGSEPGLRSSMFAAGGGCRSEKAAVFSTESLTMFVSLLIILRIRRLIDSARGEKAIILLRRIPEITYPQLLV